MATSNKQQATVISNSNKRQQQATRRRASFDISGTPIARGPKLRPKFPLPKALLPTKFGPPASGRRRSAATLLLKMAKNGPMEAEVGPNAPKMTPNLGKRFRYVKPPYHHVFDLQLPGGAGRRPHYC